MTNRRQENELVFIFLALFLITCLTNCANPPGEPYQYITVEGPVGPAGPQGPVGPQGPAAAVLPPPVVSYKGCYVDDSTRALPQWLIVNNATLESCIALGQAYGYKYVGLQWYGQCFAGNIVGFAQAQESECNIPCSANSSQVCGGYWRNSVYSTGL